MRESSQPTDAPLLRAIGLAREALGHAPAGLLTDFDGTISPIVADPALARLVEGASGALEALTRRLAVVAIITGRAPLDARRMTGVPGLLVAGNHGLEWLEPNAAHPVAAPEVEAMRGRLRGALDRVPTIDGVFMEDKGISATVHYRGATDRVGARDAIVAALDDPGPGIAVTHGRMHVELRPIGLGDKGAAARTIVERFGLRGVVAMGDDLTDLDMFAAVAELRRAGRVAAVIVGVGGGDREVPGEVIGASDVVLAHPEEAAALLTALAED